MTAAGLNLYQILAPAAVTALVARIRAATAQR